MSATCPCGKPAKVKFCSRECVGRYNTPPVGPPVGSVIGVCPCGADIVRSSGQAREAQRKFCSRACAGKFGGGRPPKVMYCSRCGWAKDAENTYSNGACRRCTLAAYHGKPDFVPAPRGVRPHRSGTARRPKPKPAPAPVRTEPERPVWRPPGWSPVPNVKRVAS